MNKSVQKIEIISPLNQLNLYGYGRYFKTFIELYSKKLLPQVSLITGSKGLGKATLVFSLVKKIFQSLINKNDINHHLNLINNNNHPNIFYLKKEFDEKTNKFKSSINIEQIRYIENFSYQSSIHNLPKFIIIDSGDDLNNNSSNALLKILEEPKKNNYIIIIAHQISNLIPTIRSRCIKFLMEEPSIEEFSKILVLNNQSIESENIDFLYDLTNRSPGLALDIISLTQLKSLL